MSTVTVSLDHYFFNDQIHSPLRFRDLVLISIGTSNKPINSYDGYKVYKLLIKKFSATYNFSIVAYANYKEMIKKLVSENTLEQFRSNRTYGYFIQLTAQGEGEYDLLQLSLSTYRQIN
ncbi:MAG: hypothetical protein HeimC2_36720 [Candidatus Heimdallarchaeota archaeon LC_2]|nr:MAG: hypothetical protein HeimC2_36720 [Candidatus Heimdallarchaeota archaeon LC_2]